MQLMQILNVSVPYKNTGMTACLFSIGDLVLYKGSVSVDAFTLLEELYANYKPVTE